MKRVILLVVLSLVICSFAFSGIQWKAKMDIQGQNKKENNSLTFTIMAQKGNVLQVFDSVEKDSQVFKKGSYWLFKSEEGKMYMVDVSERSYMEIPINGMLQMAGAMGKLVKVKIANPDVKMEKLGSETILGYTCTHYKMVYEYDMEVKIAFIKNKAHERVEKEVWATTGVKGLQEIGEVFRQRDFKTGMEDLDAMIEKQMKAEAGMGFPLKTITTTTTIDKKGNAKEKSRTTMEVQEIDTKNLPASTFEIPPDYKRMAPFGPSED